MWTANCAGSALGVAVALTALLSMVMVLEAEEAIPLTHSPVPYLTPHGVGPSLSSNPASGNADERQEEAGGHVALSAILKRRFRDAFGPPVHRNASDKVDIGPTDPTARKRAASTTLLSQITSASAKAFVHHRGDRFVLTLVYPRTDPGEAGYTGWARVEQYTMPSARFIGNATRARCGLVTCQAHTEVEAEWELEMSEMLPGFASHADMSPDGSWIAVVYHVPPIRGAPRLRIRCYRFENPLARQERQTRANGPHWWWGDTDVGSLGYQLTGLSVVSDQESGEARVIYSKYHDQRVFRALDAVPACPQVQPMGTNQTVHAEILLRASDPGPMSRGEPGELVETLDVTGVVTPLRGLVAVTLRSRAGKQGLLDAMHYGPDPGGDDGKTLFGSGSVVRQTRHYPGASAALSSPSSVPGVYPVIARARAERTSVYTLVNAEYVITIGPGARATAVELANIGDQLEFRLAALNPQGTMLALVGSDNGLLVLVRPLANASSTSRHSNRQLWQVHADLRLPPPLRTRRTLCVGVLSGGASDATAEASHAVALVLEGGVLVVLAIPPAQPSMGRPQPAPFDSVAVGGGFPSSLGLGFAAGWVSAAAGMAWGGTGGLASFLHVGAAFMLFGAVFGAVCAAYLLLLCGGGADGVSLWVFAWGAPNEGVQDVGDVASDGEWYGDGSGSAAAGQAVGESKYEDVQSSKKDRTTEVKATEVRVGDSKIDQEKAGANDDGSDKSSGNDTGSSGTVGT